MAIYNKFLGIKYKILKQKLKRVSISIFGMKIKMCCDFYSPSHYIL